MKHALKSSGSAGAGRRELALRSVFRRSGPRSAGFTLVEMMVVLALTLIMMVLFASIFQITGTFVTKQKGIGENDQSARILTTVLKTDLQNRTMRLVAPFHPNMQPLPGDGPLPVGGPLAPTARVGYFYYSENNPLDDADDVLQFTVFNPAGDTPFYGLGTFLPQQRWQAGATYPTGAYVVPTAANGFIYCATTGGTAAGTEPTWPVVPGGTVQDPAGSGPLTWTCVDATLQPDGDDGINHFVAGGAALSPMDPSTGLSVNNTGASQCAEVSYFLRRGNLYRRVLLVRQPNNTAGATQPGLVGNPINGANGPYNPATLPAPRNFWSDFDYSARFDNVGGTPSLAPLFFGTADLDNFSGTSLYPLGRPDNRFGHDQTVYGAAGTTVGAAWPPAGPNQSGNGAPREYDSNNVFFGRYTQEETSNSNFLFPGSLSPGATNPLPLGVSPMSQSATSNVTLDPTGAVILQFQGGTRRGEDILLTNVLSFDVKLLDPHYSEPAGVDLNRNGINETVAGPAFADVGHTGPTGDFRQSQNLLPSYGPHASTAPPSPNNVFDTWHRAFDFDGDGTADPAPYRPRVGNTWAPGTAYAVGAIVDPLTPSNGYTYLCATAGTSGAAEPFNPTTDKIGNPPLTDNTVTWTVQPPLGVQAIQITVKYLDPTQNLLRQVTIVQSLTQ